MTGATSGSYCQFGKPPVPAHFVTHYRCDEYADGTVTDMMTRKVIVQAPPGAARGFKRDTTPATEPTERN